MQTCGRMACRPCSRRVYLSRPRRPTFSSSIHCRLPAKATAAGMPHPPHVHLGYVTAGAHASVALPHNYTHMCACHGGVQGVGAVLPVQAPVWPSSLQGPHNCWHRLSCLIELRGACLICPDMESMQRMHVGAWGAKGCSRTQRCGRRAARALPGARRMRAPTPGTSRWRTPTAGSPGSLIRRNQADQGESVSHLAH